MTANQIFIPVAGVILLGFVVYLVLRTRRINTATAQRDHRPYSGAANNSAKDTARSIGHGQAGGGGGFT